MNIIPEGDNIIVVSPQTEIEAFYVNRFMEIWRTGQAKIVVKSALDGLEPSNRIEIYSQNPLQNLFKTTTK